MAPMSIHLVKGLNPSSKVEGDGEYSMDESAILRCIIVIGATVLVAGVWIFLKLYRLKSTRTRIGRYDILFSKEQQFIELQDSSDDNSDDELFAEYVNRDSAVESQRNKVIRKNSKTEAAMQ